MDPATRTPSPSDPLTRLRPADVAAVLAAAHDSMVVHAPALDRLDRLGRLDGIEAGDTGAHLVATLAAVRAAVGSVGTLTELASVLADLAAGSDVGHGRAGRLLVAFLGGFAELCRNADVLDATRLAMALEAGAEAATAAAVDLRPGALPAAAVAAAGGALDAADAGATLEQVVIAAADAGLDALERSPEDWPPLAEAGLVDAGSAGFLVVVDALVAVVCGDDPEPPEWDFPPDPDDTETAEGGRYEVTLDLTSPDHTPTELGRLLQRAWFTLGDEVQILTVDDRLTASVRTDDIGAVIESALGLGRPSGIVVADRDG